MRRLLPSLSVLLTCVALGACTSQPETPMTKPARSFSSLDDLAQALASAVGCEDRRDGVGDLYTDQGLSCRTSDGPSVVAMFGVSPEVMDRFINDRRTDPVLRPTEQAIVRGDGWLVNTPTSALARKVQSGLGGEVVVALAQPPDNSAAQEAQGAKLPKPQRPDLAPEDHPPPPEDQSQALLVHFGPPSGDDDLAAGDIDDAFIEAIESAGLGVGDGDENGPDGTTFFYYGPNAEAMLTAVRPVIAQLPVPPGSYVLLEDEGELLRREDLPSTSG